LIAIFVACLSCQKTDYTEELKTIAARLNTIEQRISQLEKMEQRITAYEFQLKELQEAIKPLYSLAAEAPEKQAKKTQAEEKRSVRHYLVRSGDSLYGIAKEYGLTVAELRQLNNLTKDQVIYPGQELLIDSKRTQ
jgi:LysM repeat protein